MRSPLLRAVHFTLAALICISLLLDPGTVGFYVPGVAPKEFKPGESIEIKVIV